MEERITKISRADVIWNYAATFLKIASSIILLPAILNRFPSDLVAVWGIFSSISVLTFLLDFGFNSSFVRTVTFIFSGSGTLKKTGLDVIDVQSTEVNMSLLKGTILAMRWFYSRIACFLFLILSVFGTIYIYSIIEDYQNLKLEVLIAWAIFIINNTFTLYTLYYDALLQGRGFIKESKRITIIAQLAYLLLAFSLVFAGCGIISIVSAQVVSIIIIRVLSNRLFYDSELVHRLNSVEAQDKKGIIKTITPNAVKMGLTQLGSFLISKSSIFIGSMYISLSAIASYTIVTQIFSIIYTIASTYTSTYIPRITQCRIHGEVRCINDILRKGIILSISIYLLSTILLCTVGPWALELIGSQTSLLSSGLIILISIFSYLEMNHSMAASILLTKNYVPFFIPSLIAGGITVILLLVFCNLTSLGLMGLILAPGMAQLIYQNWKWPYEVYKDLRIG